MAVASLRHVRAVALVLGRAPAAERLGRRLRLGVVERRLLLEQIRAARALAAADRLDRVGGEVEVVQVLVRDHPERSQPLGAEQRALLERRERVVVGQQAGQEVAGAVAGRAQPPEVVEAEVVEPQVLRLAAERGRDAAAERRRRSRRSRSRGRRAPAGAPR